MTEAFDLHSGRWKGQQVNCERSFYSEYSLYLYLLLSECQFIKASINNIDKKTATRYCPLFNMRSALQLQRVLNLHAAEMETDIFSVINAPFNVYSRHIPYI